MVCAVRRTSDLRWLQDPRFQTRIVDYDDPASLAPALEGCARVYHVAGVIQAPSIEAFMRGNRDVTRALVRACRGRGLERFVYVSSLSASGPSRDGGLRTERDPCRPISMYGRSKLAGEEAAREVDAPLTVIRPPVVYGPRDTGLLDLFKVAAAGLAPTIGARKRYSILHVRDLVEGTLAAADAEPGSWFLSNDEPVTSDGLIRMVARAVGRVDGARLHVPDGALTAAADLLSLTGFRSMFTPDKAREIVQRAWICSPAKAREEIGFRARVPIERGLEETARWYRDQGWLPARPANA